MAGRDLNSSLTHEERVAKSKRAGQASGKARRNKALLKDCIQALMDQKVKDPNTGKNITGAEQLSVNLWMKALAEADTAKAAKAFEVLRDTSGQKPADKIEQTTTNVVIDFGEISSDN